MGKGDNSIYFQNCRCSVNYFQNCSSLLRYSMFKRLWIKHDTCIGAVRLVGGSYNYEGRVEVLYNDVWGTSCHDLWDDRDATVVCRQLGLPYGSAIAMQEAFYGEGSGQIWLDNVRCTGTEDSLDQCQHSKWGIHNCDHSNDATVLCVDGKYFCK